MLAKQTKFENCHYLLLVDYLKHLAFRLLQRIYFIFLFRIFVNLKIF